MASSQGWKWTGMLFTSNTPGQHTERRITIHKLQSAAQVIFFTCWVKAPSPDTHLIHQVRSQCAQTLQQTARDTGWSRLEPSNDVEIGHNWQQTAACCCPGADILTPQMMLDGQKWQTSPVTNTREAVGGPSWRHEVLQMSCMSQFLIKGASSFIIWQLGYYGQECLGLCWCIYSLSASMVHCGPKPFTDGAQLLPPIKNEWGDNKGELGGPFISIQRLFTAPTKLWVWRWMMSQRSKFICGAAVSRVTAGFRSTSRVQVYVDRGFVAMPVKEEPSFCFGVWELLWSIYWWSFNSMFIVCGCCWPRQTSRSSTCKSTASSHRDGFLFVTPHIFCSISLSNADLPILDSTRSIFCLTLHTFII